MLTRELTKDEKGDMNYIVTLWKNNINNVNRSEIESAIKNYINDGISSDFLAFTVRYIIKTGSGINHPLGLKYYFGDTNVNKAYIKFKYQQTVKGKKFVAVESDNAPTCATNKQSNKGFSSVLGGN